MRIIVIGCGVSGLSCAIRLIEAGHEVTIWSRELPPYTTSNVAAAIWYPFQAFPEDKVAKWGKSTFNEFSRLVDDPQTGIKMTPGTDFLRLPTADPLWKDAVLNFRHATEDELVPGYEDGFVFETPIIEMSTYLHYLMERFKASGGAIIRRNIFFLSEPLTECDCVVNCTGLGAPEICSDEEMYPIRGQIIRISKPVPDKFYVVFESHPPIYIIPRFNDCILGGTTEEGFESTEPDPQTAQEILGRCSKLLPELKDAEIIEHRAGLRPGRSEVRLEVEFDPSGKRIIHNYGHGGSGVTVSWGCADEVLELVGDAL